MPKIRKKIINFSLRILSLILFLMVKLRFLFYNLFEFCVRNNLSRTICVGNLSVGGSGKTPFVISLVHLLNLFGLKLSIISRGYKSSMERVGCILANKKKYFETVLNSGDEPYLFSQILKNIPMLSGKNKINLYKKSLKKFEPDIIIFEDIYQYLKVKCDINILLISCFKPFGNNHLLPYGTLREPLSGINRANEVVLTRKEFFKKACTIKSFFNTTFYSVHKLVFKKIKPTYNFEHKYLNLTNLKVTVFSGLANNDQFYKSVEKFGFIIIKRIKLKDHHKYIKDDLKKISKILSKSEAKLIVTTSKDYVKIKYLSSLYYNFLIFDANINFECLSHESLFINFLSNWLLR